MCRVNINLAVNPLKFNNLSYMIVTHYQNKMLYNKVLSSTNFTDLLMFSCIHRSHALLNNANKLV